MKRKKRISKNTAYKKGRSFEYRVANYYRKLGYYVKRSYASKGAEDLIAIKTRDIPYNDLGSTFTCPEVLLIQCKNLKVEKSLSKTEKENLLRLAKQTGGTAIHIFNRNHKLVFECLN